MCNTEVPANLPGISLPEYLKGNKYPGRGIAVGMPSSGDKIFVAYFIMGRSANSRNRIFDITEDGIRTKAFDESKMEDPTLIIYRPVRRMGDKLIVTNGDQTDTIFETLTNGGTFEDALRTRCYEEDPPNYTPRISLMVELGQTPSYKMSILKSAYGFGGANVRNFFEYDRFLPGYGHFISTYEHDGNPLPSFPGEPLLIDMADDLDSWVDALWSSLDEDNKISLFVQEIDVKTGVAATCIINKHEQ
ncbi:MAG: IMP cyclohydrolase [Lachnospiraceae bacterium]|nr:IMP cyclohydrolase [Candidatus Equihabitans merdae]